MKKQVSMRPHDIVILVKIAIIKNDNWLMKDIAESLLISRGEVTESINRSDYAGLINKALKHVNKSALLNFIKDGLPFVFPQKPAEIVRGIATAHSANPLKSIIKSNDILVWQNAEGNVRGQLIVPLHPKLPQACLNNQKFYEAMALVEAIRVGKAREKLLAFDYLKAML